MRKGWEGNICLYLWLIYLIQQFYRFSKQFTNPNGTFYLILVSEQSTLFSKSIQHRVPINLLSEQASRNNQYAKPRR